MKFVVQFVFLLCFYVIITNAAEKKYAYDDINKDLLENADAIIRNDEMVLTVVKEDQYKSTVKYAITILDKKDDWRSKIYVSYDKDSKVNYIKGRLYDEYGNFSVIVMEDGYEMSLNEFIQDYGHYPDESESANEYIHLVEIYARSEYEPLDISSF